MIKEENETIMTKWEDYWIDGKQYGTCECGYGAVLATDKTCWNCGRDVDAPKVLPVKVCLPYSVRAGR